MSSGSSGKITSALKRPFKKLLSSSRSSEPLDEKPAWEDLESDEERLKSIVAFYAPKPWNRRDDTLSRPNPFLKMSRIYMESGGSFEMLVSVGQLMKSSRIKRRIVVEGEIAFWKYCLTTALVAHGSLAKGSRVSVKAIDFVQSAGTLVGHMLTSEQRDRALMSAAKLGDQFLNEVDWDALTHWNSTTLPSPDSQTNLGNEMVSLADSTQSRDTLEENLSVDVASDQESTSEEDGDESPVHLSAKAEGKMPERLSRPQTPVHTAGSDDDWLP